MFTAPTCIAGLEPTSNPWGYSTIIKMMMSTDKKERQMKKDYHKASF